MLTLTRSLRSLSIQLSAISHQLRAPLTAIVLLFSGGLAAAAPVSFDIPAQPVSSALQAFAKQSGLEVLFPFDELKSVQSKEVKGQWEPAVALKTLLDGTGYEGTKTAEKNYVVKKASSIAKTGSVRGTLFGAGAGLADVLIAIRETGQSATTDRNGSYVFPKVAAGTYVLVATASGYQPLHIVDVVVSADRDLTLGKEEMRKALGDVTNLEPFIVRADAVTELEKYQVEGQREKPFTGANVDLPRTINDAQPYYIFDSKVIEQSGAQDVDGFLKQRLTMNATALTNGQISGSNTAGNVSSINLRGLGVDKTLILVNGRRVAGVSSTTLDLPPDLNGIPMSAIDRIEVLPSSASGIYGGSAIGGVVNVILKKNYAGGEVRVTYDNTWDADAPTRRLSATYGLALEDGKTHVMLNASWSDAKPLVLQDRRAVFENNLARISQNSPDFLGLSASSFLGALPNVVNNVGVFSGFTLTPNNLVLKPAYGGTPLSSGLTHVPAGTTSTTPTATLVTGLVANLGVLNFDLPASTQAPTGLLRPFGVAPEAKYFKAGINRQMTDWLELFADYSYAENNSDSIFNVVPNNVIVPSISPLNPFTTNVRVRIPDATQLPQRTESTTRIFTAGAIAKLPWGWTGQLDYTWSKNEFSYLQFNRDNAAFNLDLRNGLFNPFVDSLQFPLAYEKYLFPVNFAGDTTLKDLALRGSGPLGSLPWGTPNLTVGLEHRINENPDSAIVSIFPITTASSNRFVIFGRKSVTDSGYAELTVPLAKRGAWPLLHNLELQLSGRSERYTVDTGTSTYREYINNPEDSYYDYGPTLNGERYYSKASYTSTNGTAGLKYQPVPELTFRASIASAFLPPTPDQLVKNPMINDFQDTVLDPNTGTYVDVDTLAGGNPDLKPQSSKSLNLGVIWEPTAEALKGLRLNAEYYRIEQRNAIGFLGPQAIVDLEALYPERVTRDSSGTITLVDNSATNLYRRETEGWDLSVDYTFKTGFGSFNLRVAESIILHLKNQYALALPEYDSVNFPSERDGAAKYKSNATLAWNWRNWTASWTTLYYGSYKQRGAAGGPESLQYYGGAENPAYILAQGGDTIPSQTYHDLFVGYAFGKRGAKDGSKLSALGASVLDGLTVQFGVRNVFDKVAPLDAYYESNYYASPYGDMRLRTYWLSLKKEF